MAKASVFQYGCCTTGEGGEGAQFVSTPEIYPNPIQQGQRPTGNVFEQGKAGSCTCAAKCAFTLTEILEYR